MRRITFCFLFLVVSLPLLSQSQKGVVLESTVTAGQQIPLQEVTVQVRGNINPLLTDSRGEFSFNRSSLKDKKAFTLVSHLKLN